MGAVHTLDLSAVDLGAITPPEKGERTIRDTVAPSLGLRLRAGGSRTWVLSRMEGGKTRRITLGGALTIPVDAARLMAQTEAALPRSPADPVTPTVPGFAANVTVADLLASYLTFGAKGRWKPSTGRQMESVARLYIVPALGALEARALSSQEVARWYRDATSQTTASRMALSTLSGLMLYAEDHGLRATGTNPCRGLRKKQSGHRGRHFRQPTLRRLWAALDRLQPDMPDACDAIRLLLLTGGRRSEILGMMWDRITGPRAVLEDSKTGPRTIWLNAPARAILDRRRAAATAPFVFPAPHGDGPVKIIDRQWRRICKEAEIDGLRVHDLRHHFASVGVSNGVDLRVIGQLLGHHDIDSTLVYAHLATGPLAKSAGRVSALIERSLVASSNPKPEELRSQRRTKRTVQPSPTNPMEASNG
ncbi:tyrosine-type recombinase/integrase [Sphingobium baderi]|uniref:tyrosine-type recombinase/integrase n=1 Tax=Sphingobium baderi TaxID=1332080 RepID=UPI002B410103|nr:site-specific integrase [Sphingobium baderi]WRD77223.1 site-specific integrase [Sphingobium baderi]